MALAVVLVGGRLVQLQIVKASAFETLGAQQRIRQVDLPATRGSILDRNGVPLAMSVDARDVYANPNFVKNAAATASSLAPLLGVDRAVLVERLTRKAGFVYLARKVEVSVAARVMALGLPGIDVQKATKRVYPQGTLAGQVIGFVGTDGTGLAGIEAGFDAALSGSPGREVVEVDPQGVAIPNGRNSLVRAVPGENVALTIDRDVQFAAEQALGKAVGKTGAKRGSAIVLDSTNAEVLAMANWPPLDPSAFASAKEDAIRNRVVQDAYEPGSVNKLVTAAAALESGRVQLSDMLTIPNVLEIGGRTFRDYQSHATWRIPYIEALARSSNIGTIEVAQKLGASRVHEMLDRFGLGRQTGIEFPAESTGISLPLDQWSGTSLATIPIGQGIAVTPLQMMMVYEAVAHDGVWIPPRLLRDVGGRGAPAPAVGAHRVVSSYTAAQLRAMLLNVVENGTGRSARIPGYLIGGKTGTANKPNIGKRGYSSDVVTTFIGMVPVDHPRYIVGVMIDSPGVHMSSVTAAPAFQELTSFVLAHGAVPPSGLASGGRLIVQPAVAPAPSPARIGRVTPVPAPAKPSKAPVARTTQAPSPKPSWSP